MESDQAGAIPPLAELQAQLWISRFVEHHRGSPRQRSPDALAPYEMDFWLRPRGGYDFYRDKHGVDHESYAYQLALDMGAAPTATHVLRRHGWKVFFTWAMGPNFNTKFRLVGPWADPDGASSIMRSELFDVVKRSGGGMCKYHFELGNHELLTWTDSLPHLYPHPASFLWAAQSHHSLWGIPWRFGAVIPDIPRKPKA